LSIRDFPNSVRRDEQEFGLRIDKARDQPGTGDAIDARTLTGDPFHGDLLSTLEVHGRATPRGASLFVHCDRGGDILECGSRAVEDRDLVLARATRAAAGHDLRELGVNLLPPEEGRG